MSKRTIKTADGDWKLVADQDLSLDDHPTDYVLASGGVLRVDDARKDNEHVTVWIYPEDESSAMFTITADEALSLGRWLVKTFGDDA